MRCFPLKKLNLDPTIPAAVQLIPQNTVLTQRARTSEKARSDSKDLYGKQAGGEERLTP